LWLLIFLILPAKFFPYWLAETIWWASFCAFFGWVGFSEACSRKPEIYDGLGWGHKWFQAEVDRLTKSNPEKDSWDIEKEAFRKYRRNQGIIGVCSGLIFGIFIQIIDYYLSP
jgi:hypothetical protein